MARCLGIFRELTNSPNRETDDALILKAVLEQLGHLGVETRAVTPEEFDAMDPAGWDLVLPMCETYPRLKRLSEAKDSVPILANPPDSVLNCYRTRMVPALREHPDIRFPPTEIRRVEEGAGNDPYASEKPKAYWLKRGDVHNTCDHDVVRAATWKDAEAIVRDFAEREITHWVVQPHVPGDIVKFYSVGPDHWFTWFYHDPVRARRYPFEVDELARQAALGGRAMGLELFGGDAIISPDGSVNLLDLNSWPSFALVRREAAVQIAWHLQRRLKSITKTPVCGETR